MGESYITENTYEYKTSLPSNENKELFEPITTDEQSAVEAYLNDEDNPTETEDDIKY